MKKILFAMIAAFAAISVGLTSCDLEEQVKATSISINQTSVALKVGQKIDLDAMVYPLSVETQRVVWASKDPAIATVDPYSGIVMGLSAGKTYITAVACDGSNVTASVPVTITSDASSLVPESPSTEAVPEVFNVKITTGTQMLALNDDGTTTTVTIDKNGNLSPAPKSGAILVYPADAAAAGKLVNMMNQSGTKEDFQKKYGIMTSTDGSPLKSLVSALKVVNNRNTPMSIVASSSASLTRAENVVYYNSLNVTKGWQTGSGRAILCTIAPGDSAYVAAPVGSDINIETVDGEVIVAHQTLEAGQEYPLVIEEKVIKVEKIELQMSEVTVAKGDTLRFDATVSPSDATNGNLHWASSNPAIVTVDQNGLVTAVGGGHATITATAADGSDVSASCEVTVVILVEEIKLGSKLYSVKKGSTVRAAATIVPVEADNRKVTWSSADEKIATVDKNGVVTGVGYGRTIITATATDGSGITASCAVLVGDEIALHFTDYEKAPGMNENFSNEELFKGVTDNFLVIRNDGKHYTPEYNGKDRLYGDFEDENKSFSWAVTYPALTLNESGEYVFGFANQKGTFEDFSKNYNLMLSTSSGYTPSDAWLYPMVALFVIKNSLDTPVPVCCHSNGAFLSELVLAYSTDNNYWMSNFRGSEKATPLCTIPAGEKAYVAVPAQWGVKLCNEKGEDLTNSYSNIAGKVIYLNINTGVAFQEGLFNSETKW